MGFQMYFEHFNYSSACKSYIVYLLWHFAIITTFYIYCKCCIYQKWQNVHILRKKGRSVSRCGKNISLMSNDDGIMFGNKVGIKRDSTIHLYNERNKSYRICPGKTELRLSDLRDKSQARNKLLTQTKRPILR